MRRTHLPTLLAAAFLLAGAVPAAADSRGTRRGAENEATGDSCGRPGETPEYFRARYQWYVETYGENGVFSPEKRLAQLREAYAEYRRDVAARRVAQAPFAGGGFRFLGPTNGAGRMPAVEVHPTDPNVVYAGAAGGGCWKSTDGGSSWRALTDGLGDLSVGAVVVAPTNPNVVYLGTGEGGYAIDFIPGIGVLRSTDGGGTWQLPASVVAPLVYRLSVDPRSADTVLAFTNNGVQRSTDGGLTWKGTSDPAWADATDVARDPTNPDVLHATFWIFGSQESAKYARSTDGGATWAEKGTGLPVDPKSRMSLGISSDGKTVYSLITSSNPTTGANGTSGLFRSTDGGNTWLKAKLIDTDTNRSASILGGQGWYDNCLAVDPDNAKNVILGGVLLYGSSDGGDAVTAIGLDGDFHVDQHQLVFKKYASGTKVIWLGNDGGVYRSTDGGSSWVGRNSGLATRQYYSVSIDPTRPEIAYAGSQDNGTDRRGSDSTELVNLPDNGGDGFETAVDPDSPGISYITAQSTSLWRSHRDGAPLSFGYVARPFAGEPYGSGGGDTVKPFLSWVTLDPNSPKTVYTGTWRVWRSEDAGETWQPLASDAFNPNATTRALAVALGNPNRILVAQSNRVLLSNDRGSTFTQLTSITNTPPNQFRNVEIDPTNPDVLYVCLGTGAPGVAGLVMKSTDAGATFARADSGLPTFGVETVRVDPGDPRTLYAGTLVGLFRSTNGGTTWSRWGDGLPAAAVHEVRITRDGSRLALATHGRGLWGASGLNPNLPPVARIDSPAQSVTIDAGASVAFSGSASDPNGDPVTLRWTFGDRTTGTGPTPPAVPYRTPGTYLVSLVAEDPKGGRGVAFTQVTVRNPNTACASATPIALIPGSTVVVRTSNGGAKDIDPSAPTTCADPAISYPIWFTFTPPANGTVDLDTLGSEGDTVLALYQGSCDNLGTALDCNDDASGVFGGPSQLKTLAVVAGKPYMVLVASWAFPDAGYLFSIDRIRVRALFKPTSGTTAGTTAVLPVVLDAFGKAGSHFTSDLTLLNRGTAPLAVALTYGGNAGSGEATSTVVLPAGAQVRAADALNELRREGIAIPRTTQPVPQLGAVMALTSGDAASLVMASRTSTPNPNTAVGGTFGLFVTSTLFADTADTGAVYIYGLRQTDQDRANLAVVHVRTPGATADATNPITLQVDVFDAQGKPAPQNPIRLDLRPAEWNQLTEVLSIAGLPAGAADGAYARITRVAGTGRFVVYGVVNDQKTSDGSLLPMTRAGEMKAGDTLVVPVVLEAPGVSNSFFTSELVLASRSAKAATVTLRYVAAPLFSGAGTGSITVTIPPGSQRVIPNLVQFLRSQGLAIPSGGSQGGALFVSFGGLDASDDVYAGVRTGTPNPDQAQGGAFGVFSPGVPPAGLASSSATVAALRQDASVRSNLAAVNAGANPITLSVQLRSAADGSPLGTALSRTLGAGEFFQWSGVFDQAGAGSGEAYAVITRTSGDSGWFAYGVLNDAKTSDGSVIGAVK